MDCNTKWRYSCCLYKIENSSTDLQACLQILSNNLCNGLVLKIHSVVEIQIQASFAMKNLNSRWTVPRNENTLAVYIKLKTHQRIFNRVFRCHQKILSWFSFKDSSHGTNTDLSVFCNKKENSRWTLTRNEKALALYIKLNALQRIFNRVFRCHQIICVMV